MSKLPNAGAEISISRQENGQTQAWLVYHLDIESGVYARTFPIDLEASEHQPGSQGWTKDMLIQVIEHI